MTEAFVLTTVISVAAVLGVIAGRAIAAEGENWLTSVLGAAYIGAGVGLMFSILVGPLLSLIAQLLNTGASTWFDALDVAGKSLLWGTAAGAAGGLAIGVVVASLSLGRSKRTQMPREAVRPRGPSHASDGLLTTGPERRTSLT
jgi:uncharacterized protein YacL